MPSSGFSDRPVRFVVWRKHPAALLLAVALHAVLLCALTTPAERRPYSVTVVRMRLLGTYAPNEEVGSPSMPLPQLVHERLESPPDLPDILIKKDEASLGKTEPPAVKDPKRVLMEAAALRRAQEVNDAKLREQDAVRAMAERTRRADGDDRVSGPVAGTAAAPARAASYADQLAGLVRRLIAFEGPAGLVFVGHAEFEVRLRPSGNIAGVRLLKSSGLPRYDEAVERAIWLANPLPPERDGNVDRTVVLRFHPLD